MSDKPKFTKEQEYAIKEKGNIIVSAGAGSGKTAVLSERVLYYIKNKGFHINEFLILTFTNLAASEMRERIRGKLIDNNLEDKDLVDISDISTFDGFSNSLVKKYHTYLNLSANFTIIDSNIISVLKFKLIKEELENLYRDQNQILLKVVDRCCNKDDQLIEDLIFEMLHKLTLTLDKNEYLNNFVNKYFSQETFQLVIDEVQNELSYQINELMEKVETLPDLLLSKGDSYQQATLLKLEELDQTQDYDELIAKISEFKMPSLPKGYKDLIDEDEILSIDIFKDKVKKLKDFKDKLSSRTLTYQQIQDNLNFANLLVEIVRKIDEKLTVYKFEHQAFEFSDIGKFAIDLVKKFPLIRSELKNKYRMIMIDEYQDTNELQEVFVSYIQNNNVYCVGDIKQSIYAFRNARCDIFKNKYDLYKSTNQGIAIDLNKNFRSREEVLLDINQIFQEIMTDQLGGANYRKDHIIQFGNTKYLDEINENQNNHLEILTYDSEKKSNIEKEIHIIANDIVQKINDKYQVIEMKGKDKAYLRPCQFKDFAIIIDRGTSFEDYLKIFAEYQIPIFMEKDEDLKSNEIVLILSSLLTIIKYILEEKEIDGKFRHSFISVARSFIVNYSEENIYHLCKNNTFYSDPLYLKLKEVINKNQELSSYLLLAKVIDELDIYSKFITIGDVEKNQVYLDFFLDTFKEMEKLDFDFDDFVSYLENLDEYGLKLNLSSEGTTLNSVRLINIHKSKGLEFNIVYFPNLAINFPKIEKKKGGGISDKFGLYLKEENDSMVKIAHNLSYKKDEISEKIRLFYVALTRAREKMIFVMPKLKKYNPVSVQKAESMYDLFFPFIDKFQKFDKNSDNVNKLNINCGSIKQEKYQIEELEFNKNRKIQVKKASKDAIIDVDKSTLEFGEIIHFILEVIDFQNPDFSIIKSSYILKKVKAFLSWLPIKDFDNCKIYKEYEFVDLSNNTNGVIDLYLLFENQIVLIDYKTKNIDDLKYDEQLKVYYNFLKQKYKLPIKCYLYSLIDQTSRFIEFK